MATITALTSLANNEQWEITKNTVARSTTSSQLLQPNMQPEFTQPRDLTLLISSVKTNWPDNYTDNLLVWLNSQTNGTTTP